MPATCSQLEVRPTGTAPGRCSRRVAAFTLLEILLAVAILLILTVVVREFTDTTMDAVKFSEKIVDHEGAYGGVRRLIETQLGSMPASETGSFLGINIKGKNGRRDMLQMVCPAGNAVLTPDAKGFYQVTLGVRENPRGSGKYFLGMQREPWTSDDEDDEEDEDTDDNGNAKPVVKANTNRAPKQNLPADWLPLMPGVTSLEIAYFDARLNGWVDKWTDQGALPNLVRLRLGADKEEPPYEMIARVPGGGQRVNVGANLNFQPTTPDPTNPQTPGVQVGTPGIPGDPVGPRRPLPR